MKHKTHKLTRNLGMIGFSSINLIFLLLFMFILFIFNGQEVHAQNDSCGLVLTEPLALSKNMWANVDQSKLSPDFSTEEIYVLKVRFWDVKDNKGNNVNPLSQTQALNAVARLNRDFNSFNIFFKYDGIKPLNKTIFQTIDWDNGEPGVFLNFIENNQEYTEIGAINIYSVDDISDSILAYYTRHADGRNPMIVSERQHINDSHHMTHEVAHNFFLGHVFGPDDFGHYENVIRFESSPFFNATWAGDHVIDTNATPENMQYDPQTCTYIYNGELDSVGFPYNYLGLEPEVKNFMSYAHACSDSMTFTTGQKAYMRNHIEVWDHHPTVTLFKSVHVSELYKPFKGEYSGSSNTNGNLPVFQYGFDYKFVDTTLADEYDQPSDYYDTSFWYGQPTNIYPASHNQPIVHLNHSAIIISQLGDIQPRMCYNYFDNVPVGGTLIKFLDGVHNANVTITKQDSLQINNTNFIDNLEPGLYNIIEEYNDGTSKEKTIFKKKD